MYLMWNVKERKVGQLLSFWLEQGVNVGGTHCDRRTTEEC